MAKDQTAAKIAALSASSTTDELKAALRDRSNHVVAKAAALAPVELAADLAVAFERLFRDPVKNDPQCTGKIALFKALDQHGELDPALGFRAARHVQMEPSFGPPVDTAAPLRGMAAMSLAANPAAPLPDVYRLLVDLLTDTQLVVRADAARALGQLEHPQSELLLRLKVQCGDAEPEVIGTCFDALLAIGGEAGLAYVARYLDQDDGDPLAFEAASALGASRNPAAFELMLGKLASGHPQSDSILRCLAPHRFRPEWRARIEATLRATENGVLLRVFAREFPEG